MDVELRVASRHLRENRSEVSWAERKRHSDSQAAAQIARRQNRFPRQIDFSAGSGCMVSKREPSFCESSAASGSCKKLDAEFLFESNEPPADDRLGDAEPAGGGRNATSVSNFHECPQIFNVQFGVPDCATQLGIKRRYRRMDVNGNVRSPDNRDGCIHDLS
jgi:hypothetical protein